MTNLFYGIVLFDYPCDMDMHACMSPHQK